MAAAVVVEGELRSVNPGTLEVVGSVAVTEPDEVAGLVAEAAEAQEGWGESSFDKRRAMLLRVARTLPDRMDDITATITAETGKPIGRSLTTELPLPDSHLLRPA